MGLYDPPVSVSLMMILHLCISEHDLLLLSFTLLMNFKHVENVPSDFANRDTMPQNFVRHCCYATAHRPL